MIANFETTYRESNGKGTCRPQKKIARYRRSLAVMNDPDTIRMIERVLKEAQERLEAAETR